MKRVLGYGLLAATFFAAGWWSRGLPTTSPSLATERMTVIASPDQSSRTQPTKEQVSPRVLPVSTGKFSKQKTDANRLIQEAMEEAAKDDGNHAAELFEKALKLDPRNESVLSNYSNFLVMNHDCEAAAPILKQCVNEFPKNQLCRGNSTTCVFDDPDALDQATDDCLKSDPKNMMCLNNRGQLFLRRKDFTDALLEFQKMEELDGHAQISFNAGVIDESLALAFDGLGNQASAQDYFQRGCKEGMPLSCKKIARY